MATYPFHPKLSAVARLGLDLGDDDGLMLGAGIEFHLHKKVDLRGEFVMRDNVDSIQVNAVVRPF